MKKKSKRIFAALLSVILCLQFSACTKETESEKEKNTDNSADVLLSEERKYVYKASSTELKDEEIIGEYESFSYSGGKIRFISEYSADDEKTDYYLNSFDTDGKNFSSVKLSDDGLSYICPPYFDESGNGYYIEAEKADDKHIYSLVSANGNGEKRSSTDITDIVNNNIPDMYPRGVLAFGENIAVYGYDGIIVLNKNGELVKAFSEITGISSVACSKNNNLYAYSWSGDGYKLYNVNISDGSVTETPNIPIEGYSNMDRVIGGGDSGYDLFISDEDMLYGYNLNGEKTELINWVESGVSITEISNIFYAGDETFITVGKSFPGKNPKFSVITKVPFVKTDKKEIVLAGSEYSVSASIANSVINFNNLSDNYFITVKKYDYEDKEQMNLDMISGKMPDILISDSSFPMDNYISKGLFADMYGFLDNDIELKREDFVPNLLKTCETDGKLYRFTDSFMVYTVLGKTSVFGEKQGITIDRLNEILAKRPEKAEGIPGTSKQEVLNFAMSISGGEYIDFKNNTCNFDSDGFIKILEYADFYPDASELENYFGGDFWDRYETMFADESALLMVSYLTDYSDIYRFEKANFGEKVTAVGFPRENGIGTSFMIESGFSISESSDCKEGAWDFLRTLLLPEYQDYADGFPVRTDSLEKSAEYAMKHDPNRDNYSIVMMGSMAFTSGVGDIGEPSEDDIRRVNEIIASANGIYCYDENVMNIISEEAESFFAGKNSAKETAQNIQSRSMLYLNEKS